TTLFRSQTRMQLEDAEQAADALIADAKQAVDENARQTLVGLLKQRRDIVARLAAAKNRYVDVGRDLRATSQQYQETATAFATLVDERLFWLPTFTPMDWAWLPRLAQAIPAFFALAHFGGVMGALGRGMAQWPWIAAFGLVVFVLLMAGQRVLRGQLRNAAEPVGNVRYDTFWVTLRAGGASALLCLPWALLLALAGWLVVRAPAASPFVVAVGVGLIQLAQLVLFVTPFRHVCQPFGLAQSHFHWPDSGRRRLRRSLRYLLYALMVPAFFVSATEMLNDDSLRETIGRVTFI